jgi:drug/metabolite transporter (DMT)-like permease
MRILLTVVLPLFAPILVFFAWAHLEHNAREKRALGERLSRMETPWMWLAFAGVVLATTSTLGLHLLSYAEPASGTYVPPSLGEGGRVLPGRVEQR